MAPTQKSLTDQLRYAIKRADVTPYRICKDTQIDPASMSRFLSGQTGLSMDHLDAVCRYLGLELRTTGRPKKRSK